ncbi:MAG: hypothetical protein Q8922_10965 [Bacteroidota bacterium]|nr:hypothetical protein [Bacteroidota bacterium]MDP4233632.1 hypothetical protein [Bacteroidota bacterium]MDP4243108.1 hypothetical protein [Bacteroidota bacterium]MDP4288446.1 hypothetical protein [Bacteroidota bacterium]
MESDSVRLQQLLEEFAAIQWTDRARALEITREGVRLAREAGDHRMFAGFIIKQVDIIGTRGEHRPALDLVNQAVPVAESLEDSELLAKLYGQRATYRRCLGEPTESVMADLERCRQFAANTSDMRLRAWIAHDLAIAHATAGEWSKMLDYAQELLSYNYDRLWNARALRLIASVHHSVEDWDSTEKLLRQGLEILESTTATDQMHLIRNDLGHNLLKRGEYAAALEQFRLLFSSRLPAVVEQAHIGAAKVYFHLGDLATAHDELSFAGSDDQNPTVGYERQIVQAELLAAEGKASEAISVLHALEQTIESSCAYLCPSLYEVMYKASASLGEWEQAFRYLSKSTDLGEKAKQSQLATRLDIMRREIVIAREQMETEKLRAHAEHLEKHVTTIAMQAATQVEALTNLRQDVLTIMREEHDPYASLKRIRNRLKMLPCAQVDWVSVEREFASANPDFKSRLEERFPMLSLMEVRVCSMLKLGLKTNEVARLFCITPRAIEFHRLNLRKKFGLRKEDNLERFLAAVGSGSVLPSPLSLVPPVEAR